MHIPPAPGAAEDTARGGPYEHWLGQDITLVTPDKMCASNIRGPGFSLNQGCGKHKGA